MVVPKDGNLRSERCPHEDSLRLNIIHTVYIDIYINYNNYSIKNYVNSYLTMCMAQSIKLVSCNNNNKDTTIYLLVSLSSFNSYRLLLFVLIYSCILPFFFAFFPTVFFACDHPVTTCTSHIRLCTQLCSLTIEKIGNFRYQSALFTFFQSSIIVIFNIVIMYK